MVDWIARELARDGADDDASTHVWRAVALVRGREGKDGKFERQLRKSERQRRGGEGENSASALAEELDGQEADQRDDDRWEWLVQWRPPVEEADSYPKPVDAQFWMPQSELLSGAEGADGVNLTLEDTLDDLVDALIDSHTGLQTWQEVHQDDLVEAAERGEDDSSGCGHIHRGYRCRSARCVRELLGARMAGDSSSAVGEAVVDEFEEGIPFWRALHLLAGYHHFGTSYRSSDRGGHVDWYARWRGYRSRHSSLVTRNDLEWSAQSRAREWLFTRQHDRFLKLSHQLGVMDSLLEHLPQVAREGEDGEEDQRGALWDFSMPLTGERKPPLLDGDNEVPMKRISRVHEETHTEYHRGNCRVGRMASARRGAPGIALSCQSRWSVGCMTTISESEIQCECSDVQTTREIEVFCAHGDVVMAAWGMLLGYEQGAVLRVDCVGDPQQSGWVVIDFREEVRSMDRSESGDLLVGGSTGAAVFRQEDMLRKLQRQEPSANGHAVRPLWRVGFEHYMYHTTYRGAVPAAVQFLLEDRALIALQGVIYSVDFGRGCVGPVLATGLGAVTGFAVIGERVLAVGGGDLVLLSLETRLVVARHEARRDFRPTSVVAAGNCFVVVSQGAYGEHAKLVFFSLEGVKLREDIAMTGTDNEAVSTSDGRVMVRTENNELIILGSDGGERLVKSARKG
jgi:hypothetical protein